MRHINFQGRGIRIFINMKSNKGFTLIEMLVVVAIIGILSAAVLVALGPSRDKAKDARITSAIQQARAIAETLYNPASATPYADFTTGQTSVIRLVTEVTSQGGTLAVSVSGTNYRVSSPLLTKTGSGATQYYCVDSTGTAKITTTAPSGSACP